MEGKVGNILGLIREVLSVDHTTLSEMLHKRSVAAGVGTESELPVVGERRMSEWSGKTGRELPSKFWGVVINWGFETANNLKKSNDKIAMENKIREIIIRKMASSMEMSEEALADIGINLEAIIQLICKKTK